MRHGHQSEEHAQEVGQRRRGEEHFKKIEDASTYHGTRRRHWRLTDHSGGKLLPNVPCCTGGTKSK